MLKVFEAFSGVGAQRMALRNLGIEHEVVGISEIDKFAIKSYEAIHGETVNFGDISKLNPEELPSFDLFTYSFPCQDLSVAGKQQGMLKGQTRSGLLKAKSAGLSNSQLYKHAGNSIVVPVLEGIFSELFK